MADYTEQERAQLQQQVMEEMRLYGQLHRNTADEVRDASVGVKGFSKQVRTSSTDVMRAYADLTKQIYNGAQGMSVFNNAIETTATAVAAFGLLMGGPIVKAVSVAFIGLAKAIGMANEMSDKTYKSYQDLASIGGIASDSLRGLREESKSLNYTIMGSEAGMSDFIGLVKENSKSLALFKGTVFEGRHALADTGAQFMQYRESLYKLGLSTDAQNKGIAGYIALQTRLGRAQEMSYKDLAAGAAKYLKETQALAAITGARREELEAEMQRALGEQQYRARITELEADGQQGLVKSYQNINAVLAQYSPKIAEGFRGLASSGLQSEEAQQLNIITGGKALQLQEDLNAGRITEMQYLSGLQQAIKENEPQWRQAAKFNRELNKVIGDYAPLIEFAKAGTGDFTKAMSKAEKQQGEVIKNTDDELLAQIKTRQAQIDASNSMSGVIEKFVKVATDVTQKLAELWKSISQTMLDIINAIGKTIDYLKYEILGMSREKPGPGPSGDRNINKQQYQYWKDIYKYNPNAVPDWAKKLIEEEKRTGKDPYASGAAGAPGASGAAPALPPAPPPAGAKPTTTDELRAAGLRFSPGDRQKEGAVIHPKLIALAQEIQANVPSFSSFTSFNDRHHQDKNSQHNRGLALDFVLSRQPGVEAGNAIINLIKSLGASKVLDEYNFPSPGATGGHFHAEVPEARYGGIFSGSQKGFPAILHGREAVLPLPNGDSVPISLNTDKLIESFSEALKRNQPMTNPDGSMSIAAFMSTLQDMVSLQREQNDLVGKLLQAQRA